MSGRAGVAQLSLSEETVAACGHGSVGACPLKGVASPIPSLTPCPSSPTRASSDYDVEKDFWKSANASVGQFINWPLGLAGLVPVR